MTKKIEQNTDVLEIPFNFPSVVIDGVEGITVYAFTIEEAQEKLSKLFNKKS